MVVDLGRSRSVSAHVYQDFMNCHIPRLPQHSFCPDFKKGLPVQGASLRKLHCKEDFYLSFVLGCESTMHAVSDVGTLAEWLQPEFLTTSFCEKPNLCLRIFFSLLPHCSRQLRSSYC